MTAPMNSILRGVTVASPAGWEAPVLDVGGVGVWHDDLVTGNVLVNAAWFALQGYQPGEIDPRFELWRQHLHPMDCVVAEAAYQAHLRGETPFYQAEYRVRHREGHWVWVQSRGQVISRDADGNALSYGGVTFDITPLKQTQELLAQSDARFRSLAALSSDWYWEQDAELRFTCFEGGEGQPIWDTLRTSALGRHRWEIPYILPLTTNWDEHRAMLMRRERFSGFEYMQQRPGQPVSYYKISGEPVFDSEGQFQGYRGVARDVTARKLAEVEAKRLATTDELTGLMNRREFMGMAEHELNRARRYGQPMSLFMIDLDYFKQINDRFGHAAGDAVLCDFAQYVGAALREPDVFARLGGEEFAILLPQTQAEGANFVARRILQVLAERELLIEGHAITYSASIGYVSRSSCQLTDASLDDLLRLADRALYRAKALGRRQAVAAEALGQVRCLGSVA